MIKPLTKDEALLFLIDGKKEGLCFCASTEYYGYFENSRLVGIAGLIMYSNKVVFKNNFVIKSHRRMGICRKLFDFGMGIVLSKGIKKVEATCTKMSLPMWLNLDAKVIAQYKYYTKVQIDL